MTQAIPSVPDRLSALILVTDMLLALRDSPAVRGALGPLLGEVRKRASD